MSTADTTDSTAGVTRKPVSRRVRFEVLRRDNYTCRYCRSTENELTVDHLTPVALGGSNSPENLVAACKDCNAGKASTGPDEATVAQATDDAIRWAAAIRIAAGLALDDLDADRVYADKFDDLWCGWHINGTGETVDRPIDWRLSLSTWRSAGLPIELILDGAQRAMSNTRIPIPDKWRYFCGITWNRLTAIQNAAAQSVAESPKKAPHDRWDPCCEQCWTNGVDAALMLPHLDYANAVFTALRRTVDGSTD